MKFVRELFTMSKENKHNNPFDLQDYFLMLYSLLKLSLTHLLVLLQGF